MKTKNRWILMLWVFSGFLNAQTYTNTSYYVAYDSSDNTQYVLVMPSVNKVYTHQAGHIAASDLSRIDTQFESSPEYNNGQLCFSSLNSDANGEGGAAKMAGNCYEVKFFYTQKEVVPGEGVAFMLIYTPTNTVYEGLAGDASSFKMVRKGTLINNINSITQEDYTLFTFDIKTVQITLDDTSVVQKLILPPTLDILPALPTIKGDL